MSELNCRRYTEMLVDYADGALPAETMTEVEGHLAACETCRRIVHDLRNSLALANVVWTDAESDLVGVRVTADRPRRRGSRLRVGLIAASVMVLVTSGFLWRVLRHPEQPSDMRSGADLVANVDDDVSTGAIQMSLAELERRVEQAGLSARLAMAVKILAAQPGGKDIINEHFKDVRDVASKGPEAVDIDKSGQSGSEGVRR